MALRVASYLVVRTMCAGVTSPTVLPRAGRQKALLAAILADILPPENVGQLSPGATASPTPALPARERVLQATLDHDRLAAPTETRVDLLTALALATGRTAPGPCISDLGYFAL